MNPFRALTDIQDRLGEINARLDAYEATLATTRHAAEHANASSLATHAEVTEQFCPRLKHLTDLVSRLATRAERIDGRMERMELYLSRLDPDYPISQTELPPDELEQTRARLERALNGVT